jgi:hypothetical protein
VNMQIGERWICSNLRCGCEIVVTFSTRTGRGTNPRCSCGSPMKKRYTAPVIRLMQNDEVRNLREKFLSKVP